jgi:hypothetical protein
MFLRAVANVIRSTEFVSSLVGAGPLTLKFKLRQANEGVTHAFEAPKERNKEAVTALLAFTQKQFQGMPIHYPSGTVEKSEKPSTWIWSPDPRVEAIAEILLSIKDRRP